MRKNTIRVFSLALLTWLSWPALAVGRGRAQSEIAKTEDRGKSIEISDVIEMVRLGDRGYFMGSPSNGRVALFSRDRSEFVVLLRKGNVVCNTNEFSLLLYKTGDLIHQTEPDVLLTMATSSNRDGIRQVRWLADNERIAFIGENPDEPSQIYLFNVRTRRLLKLTDHGTPITGYDMTPDGTRWLFEADAVPPKSKRHQEALVEGQDLSDLIAGHDAMSLRSQEVFLQTLGQAPVPIPIAAENYFMWPASELSLAPGGNYGLIRTLVRNIPDLWRGYSDLQDQIVDLPKGDVSRLKMYLLYDVRQKTVAPLVNAPSSTGTHWDANGEAVLVRTRLPLDVADPAERKARASKSFNVRVNMQGGDLYKINDGDWPPPVSAVAPIEITLEEDSNHPPRIFGLDPKTKQKIQLLDLNPQFGNLQFGKVQSLEWSVGKGVKVQGGLYLPPDYIAGKRYPLVIQTHGFNPDRFSMDGNQEWSSGYAARPLAAKGFVVLQGIRFATQQAHDHFNDDNQFGSNPMQAGLMVNVAAFEGAIDYLDQHGVIDRSKVGIVGFSRTVCTVAYLLTHSSYHFAAASMVDGIDCGYFQQLSYPRDAWDLREMMGKALPMGKGLEEWIKESPSFSLDRVTTPVKLLALAPLGVLEQWEWYAGLALQSKPVDYTFLQDESDGDNHLLTKPWERMVAGQGLVDWFCFWLQGQEDPDESKAAQYSRWRQLRRQLISAGQSGN